MGLKVVLFFLGDKVDSRTEEGVYLDRSNVWRIVKKKHTVFPIEPTQNHAAAPTIWMFFLAEMYLDNSW